MPSAALVYVDLDVGVLAHECPGGASVVEMNVGEKNRANVGHADALVAQRRAERVEAGGRARVHQGHPAWALNRRGRDNARLPEKHQVGIGDVARNRLHRREILLCAIDRQLDLIVGSIV